MLLSGQTWLNFRFPVSNWNHHSLISFQPNENKSNVVVLKLVFEIPIRTNREIARFGRFFDVITPRKIRNHHLDDGVSGHTGR